MMQLGLPSMQILMSSKCSNVRYRTSDSCACHCLGKSSGCCPCPCVTFDIAPMVSKNDCAYGPSSNLLAHNIRQEQVTRDQLPTDSLFDPKRKKPDSLFTNVAHLGKQNHLQGDTACYCSLWSML